MSALKFLTVSSKEHPLYFSTDPDQMSYAMTLRLNFMSILIHSYIIIKWEA